MPEAELPLPPHYDPARVGEVWRVPYQELAARAEAWAREHRLAPAEQDAIRTCLLVVDGQNTFCLPDFELFVAGRSGRGAVEDMDRLCRFIYRNLGSLTQIAATLDTHQAVQIFHAGFFVNDADDHPAPMTTITSEDLREGRWKANPAMARTLGKDPSALQAHLEHYVAELERRGRYGLTVWPYHAMLGGIGHALVAALEEAAFFHTLARGSQTRFELKGRNPLTENYSVLSPEVLTTVTSTGETLPLDQRNTAFITWLLEFDRVVIAGEAKSHCVAWTLEDLLAEIQARDPRLARKVHILEDCMSVVCVPGVVDYTDPTNAAFARFAEAGVRVVRSTDPLETWG